MDSLSQLRFSVNDLINDIEVEPAHVPLGLLGEFQRDVSDFLKGKNREIDPMDVQVSIEKGSLAFFASGLFAATTLWADLDNLKNGNSLKRIDPRRANVIARWQANVLKFPNRHYLVRDKFSNVIVSVDSTTNFQKMEDAWIFVEKYLHGRIIDMGGKTNPNVHLELDNGSVVKVSSSQDLLAESEKNHLYRPVLLHVTGEESLLTKELRNLRLLDFEMHDPIYDEVDHKRLVENGTRAWAEVKDVDAWLEQLRGGKE